MTSEDVPFKFNEINVNNILYKDIESNKTKTAVFLKYKKKDQIKKLVIQTPLLINYYKPKEYEKYFELNIPLIGKKENKIKNFKNFFEELDKKFIYDARLNASLWFSKQKTLFNIENNNTSFSMNYQKIIRECNDVKNGLLKIKILNNEKFKTQLFCDNNKKIGIDEIPINYYFKMILELNALWISKNSFGLFIKPLMLSFIKPIEDKIIVSYNFLEDSEESENELDEILIDDKNRLNSEHDRIIEKKLILED